ncbi:alpha/beta fold hydrolase [Nocardia nova]|uniref:alpha/beta fold hydrolase n=1 Tax=Nocardia nova TaxID=37330 RepID=UPI001FDEAC8D|nr:alpha/beta hydrolase [Nocardia nova]
MRSISFHRSGTELTAEIVDGDGPPLVIVPGVMSDAATWRPVVERLGLSNPVVTINRRGRLPSGRWEPTTPYGPRSTTCTASSTPSARRWSCSDGATAD